MATIENEETILTSDDKSITLTNNRVMYKTPTVNKEINLKDVVGHEIVQKKEKRYLGFGIATGIITYIMVYSAMHPSPYRSNYQASQDEHSPHYAVLIGLILTIIFIVSYFSVRKKFLKISGRFNSIEFSIKNLSQDNLNTFLNKLSIESENQKKEKE